MNTESCFPSKQKLCGPMSWFWFVAVFCLLWISLFFFFFFALGPLSGNPTLPKNQQNAAVYRSLDPMGPWPVIPRASAARPVGAAGQRHNPAGGNGLGCDGRVRNGLRWVFRSVRFNFGLLLCKSWNKALHVMASCKGKEGVLLVVENNVPF